MKRPRFTEEQIIGVLKEQGGRPIDRRGLPEEPDQQRDLLHVEGQVRRAGGLSHQAAEQA